MKKIVTKATKKEVAELESAIKEDIE